jgi:hypothetical protein
MSTSGQKVTFLACMLGAVASIGGFIFGYVRYATPIPDSRRRLS